MRRELAVPFLVGLGVIAAAVAGVMYMQRGAHVELKGSVLKVRTLALDENSSIAVVDFRFVNPADYPFVVRSCIARVEDSQGNLKEGATVAEADARRLFESYPILGGKFNDTLVLKDKIPPRGSEDRMVAARFEMPQSQLDGRRRLTVRIEDVDGPISELVEVKK